MSITEIHNNKNAVQAQSNANPNAGRNVRNKLIHVPTSLKTFKKKIKKNAKEKAVVSQLLQSLITKKTKKKIKNKTILNNTILPNIGTQQNTALPKKKKKLKLKTNTNMVLPKGKKKKTQKIIVYSTAQQFRQIRNTKKKEVKEKIQKNIDDQQKEIQDIKEKSRQIIQEQISNNGRFTGIMLTQNTKQGHANEDLDLASLSKTYKSQNELNK